jgi:hypothetical protein
METPAEQVSFKQNVQKNSCKKTAKVIRMFTTGEAEKELHIKGAVAPLAPPSGDNQLKPIEGLLKIQSFLYSA